MIRLTFECNGCGAKAEGTDRMRKVFVGVVNGRPWGFGSWRWEKSLEELCPEGWIASDPVTACCYCPECWARVCESEPVGATEGGEHED